ncbi:hypothetical protein, partial [Nostoc sp. DedVER01b]|uniref:hypothetical protein n=1 Tax=Nostoc sp. DedVER01b TaxID=3075404 RepID=UPI002AD58F0A
IAISADLFQFFSLFYRQMDFISATSSHFRVLTLAYLLHYFSCVSPVGCVSASVTHHPKL